MSYFSSFTNSSDSEKEPATHWASVAQHEPFFKAVPANVIQMQPATQSQPGAKTKPDLSSISASDPVSQKSHPAIINAALLANSKYAKYFSARLTGAGAIDAKGKFIVELSEQNFINTFNACYGTNETTLAGINGFYCPSSAEIHLIPNADFGMAFHESVHKASKLVFALRQKAWTDEKDFAFDLNEGLTSFYTVDILDEYKVTGYRDGYPNQRNKAAALIKDLGADEMADFYFKYSLSGIMNKLGITHPKGNPNAEVVSKLKRYWQSYH